MTKESKETMNVAQEANFFWKHFCLFSQEGELYEKIFQVLLSAFTKEKDTHFRKFYILEVNRDELNDYPLYIDAVIKFRDENEYLLFLKWKMTGVEFVLNSENIFICNICEQTETDKLIYHLHFLKNKQINKGE